MRTERTQHPVTDHKKFLHVSSNVYHLPPIGKDIQVDQLVARGELILMGEIVGKKGADAVRLARSKGVTYRRYPKDGRDRREHRDEQFGRRRFA